MSSVLRRFAAVGTLVTGVDLALFLVLRIGARLPVLVAGLVAVVVAAMASYGLNRRVTFSRDPYVRWVQQPGSYVVVAATAGILDLATLRAAVAVLGGEFAIGELLVARAAGLAAGGIVRLFGYRIVLFQRVRVSQADKVERGPAPGDVRLTVVVPAYNEGALIGDTVRRIRNALAIIDEGGFEVIVVDDGSRDTTAEEAGEAGAVVVRLPANQGKGAAVRAGAAAARGRAVAYIDADLSYTPEQLLDLLEHVESGWDMVTGSRAHVDTRTLVAAGRLREVTGRLFNLMTYMVLLGRYRDTQCGLKAFRHDVAEVLFSHARLDRFAFDVELFHLAERYQLSLVEVPVTVSHSSRSSVRVAVDAWRMVRDLFRVRRWAGRGVYDLSADEASLLSR